MPNISNVSIEHYRGFYARRELAPSIPNGRPGSGLTVLVGPNNSGKTSVLNAIRLALSPRQVDMEHRHSGHALAISITNDAGDTKGVSNPDLGANVVSNGNQNAWPTIDNFRLVPSRRAWHPYTGSQRMDLSSYWTNAFNRQASEGDDPFLVSRIAALSGTDREQFDSLIARLLPQLNTWKIELSRGQTFILYETHSGAQHAADLFGDGMASLFRVGLALFDTRSGQVVAIDEPELSLHPQAQKDLAEVLSQHAGDKQIIITTHSPYFVNWSDVSNGARVFRLSQDKHGISIGALGQQTLHDIEGLVADWQKPNLLDAVAREIFFADEVLFLEGQEDVGLLRKFSDDRNLDPLPAFGYGAGGAGNIPLFLRMARDLGIPASAIFDGDQEQLMRATEKAFPECHIELLPTRDVRDKPRRDQQGKETDVIEKEGLFDRHGVIKPEHEQYLSDLFLRVWRTLSEQDHT